MQTHLRHTDITTTANVYAQPIAESVRKLVNAVTHDGRAAGDRGAGAAHAEDPVSILNTILNTIAHTGTPATSLSDWNDGAGDGDRTRDIQLGKLAFYR